jgi:hypothetical protein
MKKSLDGQTPQRLHHPLAAPSSPVLKRLAAINQTLKLYRSGFA